MVYVETEVTELYNFIVEHVSSMPQTGNMVAHIWQQLALKKTNFKC